MLIVQDTLNAYYDYLGPCFGSANRPGPLNLHTTMPTTPTGFHTPCLRPLPCASNCTRTSAMRARRFGEAGWEFGVILDIIYRNDVTKLFGLQTSSARCSCELQSALCQPVRERSHGGQGGRGSSSDRREVLAPALVFGRPEGLVR